MSLRDLLGGDRHPLHDEAAARELLAQLPANDPLRALGDIVQWLRSVGESPEFKPRMRLAVVGLLDDAGRKPEHALMLRYLKDPRLRSAPGRIAWGAVYAFWGALADAYRRCALDELPAFAVGEGARGPLASIAVRALRARVTHVRCAMLHYEPVPADAWRGLYEVFARAEGAGIAQAAARAYEGESQRTTPQLEMTRALLVAIAAPERLPPEEVDAAFRIARRFAGAAKLQAEPFEGATHLVDLAGGAPPAPLPAPRGARPLWLGALDAVGKLEEMLGKHESAMLDEDERLAREYSPGQKITVLRQFMSYWGPNPPHADKSLIRLEGGLGVVHGFRGVCHYVPHVALQAVRAKGGEGGGPLQVVEDEELETPESWPERDAGLQVVHARAGPGSGAWAEVGDLVAIRVHDRSDWWLAAIRRLAAAAGGVLEAEFEVLSRKPLSAWLRVLGRKDRMADNWQEVTAEYVQCVVLTDRPGPGGAPLLVLPKGRYVPEQILELLHGERSRTIRLTEFLEQGRDFDRCAVRLQA